MSESQQSKSECKICGDEALYSYYGVISCSSCKVFFRRNRENEKFSTLTIDEWNLLSNLTHCYDEYSGLSMSENLMHKQNSLPAKLRLKSQTLIDLTGMALDGLRLLYEKNQDFICLSSHDRSLLLQNTIKHTECLSTNFILYKIGAMDHPMYYDYCKSIANLQVVSVAKRLSTLLDFDVIIKKLILAILSFSTINYTIYLNSPIVNLLNIKQILSIQDKYVELIYKYNLKESVKCFCQLLRCLFTANEIIIKIEGLQWFNDQQTEQALILND